MTTNDVNTDVRRQLLKAFQGGNAFDTFDDIVGQIPEDRRYAPAGIDSRSAWQVLEHMRLSLDDILDYSMNEDGAYREKEWPAGYWPKSHAPTGSGQSWDRTIDDCKKSMERMERLIQDPSRDLLRPFSWAPDHNLMRSILLAIQHNAYHLGELVELSR